MRRKEHTALGVRQSQVQTLRFTSCETSGKLFHLSEPLFIYFFKAIFRPLEGLSVGIYLVHWRASRNLNSLPYYVTCMQLAEGWLVMTASI